MQENTLAVPACFGDEDGQDYNLAILRLVDDQ